MPFILHVHPIPQLNEHLQDGHDDKQNNGKGGVNSTCLHGRKSNQGQNNGKYEYHDVFLRTFHAVTVLCRMLIRFILCRHALPHLSKQIHNRKDEYPHDVDKVPVHGRDVHFGSGDHR